MRLGELPVVTWPRLILDAGGAAGLNGTMVMPPLSALRWRRTRTIPGARRVVDEKALVIDGRLAGAHREEGAMRPG